MIIYIAGPISGHEETYESEFAAAEAYLQGMGFKTYNPSSTGGYSDLPYRTYIDIGLCALSRCDAVFLLNGWFTSKGASLEQTYARVVGMKIIEENNPEAEKKLLELIFKESEK